MTQLSQARKGILTEEMKCVSVDESMDADTLLEYVAEGWIVIPKNIRHDFPAKGIGRGLKTKVNANIGTSPLHSDIDEELSKLEAALDAGTHSVMDLSTGDGIDGCRKKILENSPVMVGTVPIYQVMTEAFAGSRSGRDISADEMLSVIEKQAGDGVDYMTLHCGVTTEALEILKATGRTGGIVSRGGSFMARWIHLNSRENPLYEHFDRILDIAFEYDVTLSLGDGLRPGSIDDAGDAAQMHELVVLGKLAERSRQRGVQVMIEGPGHVPLDEIKANVQLQKSICSGAPFYVLGPIPTDIAAGYDHITAAVGGSISAAAGADFLCYVTPAEHLKLPDAGDVREGVIAARIAAHIGDLVKDVPGAREWDKKMSEKRAELDWRGMYELALDPAKAREMRKRSEAYEDDVCSMCGHHCSLKSIKDIYECIEDREQ